MKYVILGVPIIIGILLGFFPGGLAAPKPRWWRWLAGGSLTVLIFLSFWIPTGGTFGGGEMLAVARQGWTPAPILVDITDISNGSAQVTDRNGKAAAVSLERLPEQERSSLGEGMSAVITIDKSEDGSYVAEELVRTNPTLTLPLIPALEERARNLYFHVPSAWIAQLAWFVAFFFAIRYLRRRNIEDDIKASSMAAAGAVFCILATVTGAIWAKFNWGSFWNWDPRQVSISVVLIIYGAYFALRSAIPSREQRARVSSVYLILLMLPVVFFLFVYPRITAGLHPGSQSSDNIGPVVDPQQIWLNPTKQALFALGFFSFTMLCFWIVNLSTRTRLLSLRRRRSRLENES